MNVNPYSVKLMVLQTCRNYYKLVKFNNRTGGRTKDHRMETLGKKLDVVLSDDLEASCPQFVQLLQKLSQKLNSNGRTKVNNHGPISLQSILLFRNQRKSLKFAKRRQKLLGESICQLQ